MTDLTELSKSHNLEYLRELRKIVKSEEERYDLIGIAIYLGSYNARKELAPKGFFKGKRETASRIQETSYIAKQQKDILDSLKYKDSKGLAEELKKRIEKTSTDDKIQESDLSRCMETFIKNKALPLSELSEIGKRVEKRLLSLDSNKYREHETNPTEGTLCEILLKEEEVIRHAIVFEIKR